MTSRHTTPDLGRSRRDPRGVTLLELMVALSLLALILGGIYRFVATGAQSARVANDFLQTQAQLRAVLDNAVEEIRWADDVTAAGGRSVTLLVPPNTPLAGATSYTVTFAYDTAADTVTRQVDPDAAGPQPLGPAEPVAYGVVQEDGSDGFVLEYFNATGASLGAAPADLTAIARVRLTVTTTRGRVSRAFTGDAALR